MADDKEVQLDLESVLDEHTKDKSTIIDLSGDTANKDVQPAPEQEIERLRKELEDFRAREVNFQEKITKAETERADEVRKVTSVIANAFKDKEDALEGRISAASTALTSIKEQLRAARTAGDIDKEIDLEEKLADEKYQLNALNWEKNNLATAKKTREEAAKNASTAQPQVHKYTAKEQEWISSHPRYNTDDEYQSYVWSVDALAKKRGIIPDTEAYYDFLNTRLDKQYPAEVKTQTRSSSTSVSTAAPPSRSASGGSERMGGNGRSVRLSAAQIEAAEFMGMTPVEYAESLLKIEEEKRN